MTTAEVAAKFKEYYIPIWAPPEDFVVTHGKGPYLFDLEGRKYIDFVTGIAVNALGYQHPLLTSALKATLKQPQHVSSLFLQQDRVLLAEMLVKNSFADKAFFCNSGTEAIEGCIKFARKWASVNFHSEKNKVITFYNGFHGRTYGSLSATAQEKFHHGFEPLVPGFIYLPVNDLPAFEKAADGKTVCAVLVEPVQAEGGIIPCDRDWLAQVRKICDERKIALIFDEIQMGMGRLGTLWAHQTYGIEPDIMALAKALGGGIPFGAVLVRNPIAASLKVGDHGNTTGGSPVAARLGLVVLKELLKPGFLDQVKANAELLRNSLDKIKKQFPNLVLETRGMGMLQGLVLKTDVVKVMNACRQNGLLVCKAGNEVLRFLPPLNVKSVVIKKAIAILKKVLRSL